MERIRVRRFAIILLGAAMLTGPAAAQDAPAIAYPAEGDLPAQPEVVRPLVPIPPERYAEMVPKHPGYLGALAPENLNKPRPAPPFSVTGTWFVDLREGFSKFLFGPPYPKFYAEGREALIEAPKYEARNETYRDAIGQCYPPGMPMIMTRVWPHAFIQLPTAIYMISGFNNSVRTIFLDGREHSDPDLVVPSYNGESVGRWEGDTLVVDTRYFETDNHYIDRGIPISDEFAMTERITMPSPAKMRIEYIMTDPQMWEGEWRSVKEFDRADYTDINEAVCILQYNRNLPGTNLGRDAAEDRGKSEIEGVADE
jgi:hypothetical protein